MHRFTSRHPSLAVIAAIPYDDALIAEFPADIAEIHVDPAVGRVIHLGDIESGSSRVRRFA
jgi:hypothetical protein